MRKPRKASKASVKAAADRAEGRIVALADEEPADMARDVGRPSSYRPEYVELARKLCKSGQTDREIADFFEVSIATITNWKAEDPEFLASIINARDVADERVERSLYHRAVGYTFEAEE